MCGVEIAVSSDKVYKFREYEVCVRVSARWRRAHGLSAADVVRAAAAAKCCLARDHSVAHCERCGGVVTLTVPSTTATAATAGEGAAPPAAVGGVECYVLALRSRCTSSRAHLGSPLQLCIDTLPTGAPVYSAPFVAHARTTRASKPRPPASTAGDASADDASGYSSSGMPSQRRARTGDSSASDDDSARPSPQLAPLPAPTLTLLPLRPSVPSPAAVVAGLQRALAISESDDSPAAAIGTGTAIATTPRQQEQGDGERQERQESPSSPLLQVRPDDEEEQEDCNSNRNSNGSNNGNATGCNASNNNNNNNRKERRIPRALYMLEPDVAGLLVRGRAVAAIGDCPALVRFFRSPMQPRVVRVLQEDLVAACREHGVAVVAERTHCIAPALFLSVTCYAPGTALDQGCAVAHMYMQNILAARPNVFNTNIYRAGLFEYLGDVGIAGCVH